MPKANNERLRTGRGVGREELCGVTEELCGVAERTEQERRENGARATIAPDEPCPTTNYPTAQQVEQLAKLDLVGVRSCCG